MFSVVLVCKIEDVALVRECFGFAPRELDELYAPNTCVGFVEEGPSSFCVVRNRWQLCLQ